MTTGYPIPSPTYLRGERTQSPPVTIPRKMYRRVFEGHPKSTVPPLVEVVHGSLTEERKEESNRFKETEKLKSRVLFE